MKLKIYYDGLCILCSREIDHYKKLRGSEKLEFIDITDSSFDAKKEGLDPFEVHKVMHVRTPSGQTYTKVRAFVEIWKHLPRYRWAVPIALNPVVKPILEAGYSLFARTRPYLPKRKKLCENSPFCEINDQTKRS